VRRPQRAGQASQGEKEEFLATAARYFCAYKPNYFILGIAQKGNPIEFDYASVQLGASWRQPRISSRVKFVPFFYVQYFEGNGETLIRADEHTRALRAGIRFTL
jgi:hypothetical protein